MGLRRLVSLGIQDDGNGRNLVALEAPERESSTGGSYGHMPPDRDTDASRRAGVSVGVPLRHNVGVVGCRLFWPRSVAFVVGFMVPVVDGDSQWTLLGCRCGGVGGVEGGVGEKGH